MNKTFILLLGIAALLTVSGCIGGDTSPALKCGGNDSMVQPGDTVNVEYIGTLENGEEFDSGELEFISSVGEMIEGFDEAILGMCLNEEKNVSIPPEKAYGFPNPELVLTIPVVFDLNRTFDVSVNTFVEKFESQPEVGKLYTDDSLLLPLKVVGVIRLSPDDEDGNVTMERPASVGDTTNEGDLWSLTVIATDDDKITLSRNVEDGDSVMTYQGMKTVQVNDGNITIDLNHMLAGKTLDFYIKVTGINKA